MRMLLAALLLLGTATVIAAETRELDWDELLPQDSAGTLLPEDPLAVIRGDEVITTQSPAGAINKELDGLSVRIPGFLVPLESDEGGLLTEFFLVPYFGACIHVPPPPPNQIVYVTVDEPFNLETLWTPFWIEGEMATRSKSSLMGTAGYSIEAKLIEEYEW
ncbi:MAG: DUF3299 domain-containing protein [Pseudomonadota bacterium]